MKVFSRLKQRLGKTAARVGLAIGEIGEREVFNDASLEALEDLLIQADIGPENAIKLASKVGEVYFGQAVSSEKIKQLLADEIAKILQPVAQPLPITGEKPQIILVAGVNGSGKTTTIGKLAKQLKDAGKQVDIAACDTYRAAAVEQLAVWGQRAGVMVHQAQAGSDPAALAYSASEEARDRGVDLLLIDTAGRLHNRRDLMDELLKIRRAIGKIDETAPHDVLLVVDATTGQNVLKQVEIFGEIIGLTGLIMTKLDGTARGGVLVALAQSVALPVHAIGLGEGIEDLQPLESESFSKALVGLDS